MITVQPFADEAEAIAMANGVEFGLASSVWTADHGRALRCARAFDFGCVRQHGHSPPPSCLGSAELGSCASSGYAWWLRVPRDTQGERPGHWAPTATALGARASCR